MSSAIRTVIRPTDCCATSCTDSFSNSGVPGPQGPAGADGADGTDGVNAFTTTTAQFTMPAVSGSVSIEVLDSSWAVVGQVIYVQSTGYFSVASKPDATHISATNLGYSGNTSPGSNVSASRQVGPGGLKGTDGTSSSQLYGTGSPEGAATAIPGTTYWDTLNQSLWVKNSGSGNTGWVQLIA